MTNQAQILKALVMSFLMIYIMWSYETIKFLIPICQNGFKMYLRTQNYPEGQNGVELTRTIQNDIDYSRMHQIVQKLLDCQKVKNYGDPKVEAIHLYTLYITVAVTIPSLQETHCLFLWPTTGDLYSYNLPPCSFEQN